MLLYYILNHWCACIMHSLGRREVKNGTEPNFVNTLIFILNLLVYLV